eukprot:m.205123 g.205123  ORF g.205123 m.205123 type:complete len:59 (-) comp17092_c2_seq1:162-338(-)
MMTPKTGPSAGMWAITAVFAAGVAAHVYDHFTSKYTVRKATPEEIATKLANDAKDKPQ